MRNLSVFWNCSGRTGDDQPAAGLVRDELYDAECNHSLRHAMKFMMDNRLDFGKLTSWLTNNGSYCDCKIMNRSPIWRENLGMTRRHVCSLFL